jgi:nucleotide-binding universal stress UspA family protein
MKTILVPTDFSPNAFIASQYACSLAKAAGYQVELFHVYIVLYSGFDEKGSSVKHMVWADDEAHKAMETLTANLKKEYPEVNIKGHCQRGFLIDELAEKWKNDASLAFITMGTKGATNVTESIMGSTTYEVLKKSPIPVLVIPEDTGDFKLENLGFFSDHNDDELDAIHYCQQILPLSYQMHIIHLKTKAEKKSEAQEHWEGKLSLAFPNTSFQMEVVEVEKADFNAVADLAEAEKLDVMVFMRPHKPFFEKLFKPSLTKAMAHYPVKPTFFIKAS